MIINIILFVLGIFSVCKYWGISYKDRKLIPPKPMTKSKGSYVPSPTQVLPPKPPSKKS